MNFDWTINISHLVSFFGFVIGGLIVVFALRLEIRIMGLRLTAMEETVKAVQIGQERLVSVMVDLAKQETRMDGFERRIDDLLWQREHKPPPS